jgi:potassium-dependent mechanosensitive channel
VILEILFGLLMTLKSKHPLFKSAMNVGTYVCACVWIAIGCVVSHGQGLPPTNSPFAIPPVDKTPATSAAGVSNGSASNVLPDSAPITLEAMQSRSAQVQADTTLLPEVKQSLVQTYEAIQVAIRSRAEDEKRLKELSASAEAAPSATLESKRRKENPPPRDVVSESALRSYSLQALQDLLQTQQTNYQIAVDGRTKTELAITTREARRKELPKLIADQRSTIQKLTDEAAIPASESTEPVVSEALALLGRAKVAAASERLKRLEQEARTTEAEAELLPIRKEIYTTDERYYQLRIKEINEELNKRRETKIEEERNKVLALAAEAPTEIKWLADRLVSRADAWLELAKKNTAIQLEIEQAKSKQRFWQERFSIMQNRSLARNRSGFMTINNWNGLLLRRHRSELPDEAKLNTQLDQNLTRIQQTETLIIELEDWKNQNSTTQLEDPSLNAIPADLLDEDEFIARADAVDREAKLNLSPSLLQKADRLLAAERDLVSNFSIDAASFSDNLFELSEIRQETLDLVGNYRNFIDQHILWIRSASPFSRSDTRQLWPALQWLFDVQQWTDALQHLMTEFRQRPWEVPIILVIFGALAFQNAKIRRLISALGERAARSTNTEFSPTAKTIGLTIVLSSPWVLLLAYLGYRLVGASNPTTFSTAIGMGFLVAARYFFPLELIRQICRPGGLAEKHFEISNSVTTLVRSNLRWLIDLGVPATGVVAVLFSSGDEKFENSLGRLAFAFVLLLTSVFLIIVFRPTKGVFGQYIKNHEGGWADRLRYVWYFGLCCGPVLLCFNSLMGYHYTAVRLSMHWYTTIITLVGLLILNQIMQRWLLLSRRKIMANQARLRLQQAQQREAAVSSTSPNSLFTDTGSTGPETSGTDWNSINNQVDLAEINAQTIRLGTSLIVVTALIAVFYIWSGVLPAVNMLDSIELWQVDGDKPGSKIPITLGNIILSIPIVVLMFVAARNLPGLLEIALLQYLPIENSVRYAISSLSRYVIVFVGIAFAFYYLGVRWTNVQWLVAALGVGLGFGLQEIFANFISGLILLFEQPIRVGDIITVGDTSGTVSKIRVRATTITNFEKQELIIPNKDLITGRLLNWTLSDSTTRMMVKIGLAYGSDTDLACRLIHKICTEHPNVLSDPPPTSHVEGFQDSTLLVNVRFFVDSLDKRLPTTHDIHSAIHREFNKAGIIFGFPQRDINVKSIPESLLGMITTRVIN